MTRKAELVRRKKREAAWNRLLLVAAGVLLLAGLFGQITMLSQISYQSKRASAVAKEIEGLYADVDNLELQISWFSDPEDIGEKAAKMGMQLPDSTQLRVVNVALQIAEEVPTQATENIGAESIQN